MYRLAPVLLVLTASCSLLFEQSAGDAGAGSTDSRLPDDAGGPLPEDAQGPVDAATPLKCAPGFEFETPQYLAGTEGKVSYRNMVGFTFVELTIDVPEGKAMVSVPQQDVIEGFFRWSFTFNVDTAGTYRMRFTGLDADGGSYEAACGLLVDEKTP